MSPEEGGNFNLQGVTSILLLIYAMFRGGNVKKHIFISHLVLPMSLYFFVAHCSFLNAQTTFFHLTFILLSDYLCVGANLLFLKGYLEKVSPLSSRQQTSWHCHNGLFPTGHICTGWQSLFLNTCLDLKHLVHMWGAGRAEPNCWATRILPPPRPPPQKKTTPPEIRKLVRRYVFTCEDTQLQSIAHGKHMQRMFRIRF